MYPSIFIFTVNVLTCRLVRFAIIVRYTILTNCTKTMFAKVCVISECIFFFFYLYLYNTYIILIVEVKPITDLSCNLIPHVLHLSMHTRESVNYCAVIICLSLFLCKSYLRATLGTTQQKYSFRLCAYH